MKFSQVSATCIVPTLSRLVLALAFILDPANHQLHSRELGGKMRRFHALSYHDRYIWGATAGILINLYEVLSG